MKDKLIDAIKNAYDKEMPVTIIVGGHACDMHVLSFDEIKALNEHGGVLSFFLRDLDEDGYSQE